MAYLLRHISYGMLVMTEGYGGPEGSIGHNSIGHNYIVMAEGAVTDPGVASEGNNILVIQHVSYYNI